MENEKNVYQHLGDYDGIVKCFSTSEHGIEMEYLENGNLKNGNLKKYIAEQNPDDSMKLKWIRQAARTIKYIHTKNVFIADIATRNFLVANDLSLKLCDYGDSIIMPLYHDTTEDDYAMSFKVDIAQFGSVVYELISGIVHTPEVFQMASIEDSNTYHEWEEKKDHEASIGGREGKDNEPGHDERPIIMWPRKDDLPCTDGIAIGAIIHKCWMLDGYQGMDEVCKDLADITSLRNISSSIANISSIPLIQDA